MYTILSALFSLFVLSGCTSTQEWLKTKPEAYQKGYTAGCINGEERVLHPSVIKKNDTELYNADETYRSGWDEGYQDCYEDKEFEIMMENSRRY